jgi:hypothetical protein
MDVLKQTVSNRAEGTFGKVQIILDYESGIFSAVKYFKQEE